MSAIAFSVGARFTLLTRIEMLSVWNTSPVATGVSSTCMSSTDPAVMTTRSTVTTCQPGASVTEGERVMGPCCVDPTYSRTCSCTLPVALEERTHAVKRYTAPAAEVAGTQLGLSFTPNLAVVEGPVTWREKLPSKPPATRSMVPPEYPSHPVVLVSNDGLVT